MTASRAVTKLEPSLLTRLEGARASADALFAMLPPNSYYERPIPERHRLIFYLGHLEAFDRNLLSTALGLGLDDSPFDKLFAFGIDPVGGGLPSDQPKRVAGDRAGGAIQPPGALAVGRTPARSGRDAGDGGFAGNRDAAASGHRAPADARGDAGVLAAQSAAAQKASRRPRLAADARPSPDPKQVTIPSGIATLGQSRDGRIIWLGQ